jgi:hypothetical protein
VTVIIFTSIANICRLTLLAPKRHLT